MKKSIEKLEIEGVTYVPEGTNTPTKNIEGLPLVMIRTYSAGVHFGYLEKKESTLAGIEVTLLRSRRVHYWAGAASLSQLAMEGTSNAEDCRMPCEVNSILLLAIEVIPMTEKARLSLADVAIWSA